VAVRARGRARNGPGGIALMIGALTAGSCGGRRSERMKFRGDTSRAVLPARRRKR